VQGYSIKEAHIGTTTTAGAMFDVPTFWLFRPNIHPTFLHADYYIWFVLY
jgi:hypothetical protein